MDVTVAQTSDRPKRFVLWRAMRMVPSAFATWGVGLVVLAPAAPVLAMVLAVAFYAGLQNVGGLWTILILTLAPAAVIVTLAPFVAGAVLARPDTANSASWEEYLNRLNLLRERATRVCPPTVSSRQCLDLQACLRGIEPVDLGSRLRWATRDGYMNIWMSLHRAEEALICAEADPQVLLREANHDQQRLQGSKIPSRDDLMSQLETATTELKSQMKNPPCGEASEGIRDTVASVRHAINKYVDSSFAGLVGVRNATNTLVVCTGLVALGLLGLVMMQGLDTDQLEAASIFYLIGVAVGFLHRAYAIQRTEHMVDDYGAMSATLYQTLLFSGLAGIGGVVLIAMLPAALSDLAALQNNSGSGQLPTYPKLSDLFEVGHNPFRLVIAATFGLSPELLITALKQEGATLKAQIKSMQPGEKADASPNSM